MELKTIKGSIKRMAPSPKKDVAYAKLARSSWRGSRPSATSVGSQGRRGIRSPLCDAVLNRDIQEIKRILATSVGDITDTFDDEGLSLLYQSAKNNFDDVVALFIEHGVSLDLLSSDGCTPLHIALR